MLSDHPVFPILLSRDLDASRHFYHAILGLPILREDLPDRIVFGCGDGTQLAVTVSTIGTKDIQTQLAWRVPDVRAAIDDRRRVARRHGFDPLVAHQRKGKASKAVDVSLAVDTLSAANGDQYDVAVLFGGDEDYLPLVEAVKRMGKLVWTAFFDDATGQEMKLAADYYTDVSDWLGEARTKALARNPERLEWPED